MGRVVDDIHLAIGRWTEFVLDSLLSNGCMHGSVGVLSKMHCLCIMIDEIDSHSYIT
jgi:hypothetical protein